MTLKLPITIMLLGVYGSYFSPLLDLK